LDITLFGKLEEHTRAHGFGKAWEKEKEKK
jgi:hypothetical protein